MAHPYRRATDPLIQRLETSPRRFEFHQAVRLLELMAQREAEAADRPPPTGVAETARRKKESVRFRSTVAMCAPRSAIDALTPASEDAPAEVAVSFMGLAGNVGPLPSILTELVLDRRAEGDRGMGDFLDLFNARLVALLYRARKRARPGFDLTAWRGGGAGPAHFNDILYAIIGLATDGLQDRTAVPDRALLGYAGLLGRAPRSMAALEALLSDYLQVPVAGEPFVLTRDELSSGDWTRIGAGGQNHALGTQASLGTTAWTADSTFALTLGPMDWGQFLDLLPASSDVDAGSGFDALGALVRLFAGPALRAKVDLILGPGEARSLPLGEEGGARLGWTSWIGAPPAAPQTLKLATRVGDT